MNEPKRQLRIFISYSWDNRFYRDALGGCLKDNGFTVTVDTGVRGSQEVYKDISNNINDSDVVVALITKDWIKSTECRDELVRANERRKKIIPFCHVDVSLEDLPHFIRTIDKVPWTERGSESAQDTLVKVLNGMAVERWKADTYKDVRIIGDRVERAMCAEWRAELCRKIMSRAAKSVHELLEGKRIEFDVANEHAYLHYARPIFGSADSIIAICIAAISSFWTNLGFRNEASEYLDTQTGSASSIRRLFVFSTPEEANAYKNICQAHYDAYGSRGSLNGVFVCSASTYTNFMVRSAVRLSPNYLREDFGLLTYGSPPERLYATLNEREFTIRQFDPDDPAQMQLVVVDRIFDRLSTLPPGGMDGDTKIRRWSPNWFEDPAAFASALVEMFGDRKRGIRHFVMLRPHEDSHEFVLQLDELVRFLTEYRTELQIASVSLNRCCKVPAVDSLFGAPLRVDDRYKYMLCLDFEDADALRFYYQHDRHSVEREKLYRRLNPSVGPLFDALPRTDPQRMSTGFSAIEKRMVSSEFLHRFDVDHLEPIESVVQRVGIPYGQYRK